MARLYNQYAVVETNHVAAVRDGRIKAQYWMADNADAENGMLLVVDDVAKEVGFSTDGTERGIHLHVSEERIYENHLGRKGWFLNGAVNQPKMAALAKGDIFETNAIDDGDFANLAAVKAALTAKETVYGIASASGLIELKDNTLVTTGYETLLQAVEIVTLPNETEGMKFVVVKA